MEYDPNHNGVERINGLKINLNRIPFSELITLEGHMAERVENAKTDLMIVQDYIGRRAVEGATE